MQVKINRKNMLLQKILLKIESNKKANFTIDEVLLLRKFLKRNGIFREQWRYNATARILIGQGFDELRGKF